jgi:hypothetical protein
MSRDKSGFVHSKGLFYCKRLQEQVMRQERIAPDMRERAVP